MRCAPRNGNAMGKKKRKKRQSGETERSPAPKVTRDTPPRPDRASPALAALLCLILVMLILAVFWPVNRQQFIAIDDDKYVYENPAVRSGLNAESFRYALTEPVMGHYHPLTMLSYLADVTLFGVDPGAIKRSNLLLHIANTLLLFLLLKRMTGTLWRSLFVAAFFAIHPLHVEPVVWIASRKDMLSTFFLMLTLCSYAWYVKRPGPARYGLVALCLVLGLLSKAILMTTPCLLLVLDYWPLRRFGESWNARAVRRLALEKVPLLCLSAVAAVVAALSAAVAMGSLEALPLRIRLMNGVVAYATYLLRMVWPHHLAVLYPHPANTLYLAQVFAAALVLAALTALPLWQARRRPFLIVGWLWFLGTLAPVIGLIQAGPQASADRYTYVSLIGLFIAVVWGASSVAAAWRYQRVLAGAAGGIAVAALSLAAAVQVSYWRDSETLFTHTLKVTTRNAVIHNNLGNVLLDQGRLDEAFQHYATAVRIDHKYAYAHTNLGAMYRRRGELEKALEYCAKAVELDPNYADGHSNLGNVYFSQGKHDKAITHYTKALELDPNKANTYSNLGNALLRKGETGRAVAAYREALRLDPASASAHSNLGGAFFTQGKLDEAMAHYRKALELKPDYADAHCNLGTALLSQGQLEGAVDHLTKAAALNPTSAGAHTRLANALALQGKLQDAAKHYAKALELNPKDAEATRNLEQIRAALAQTAAGDPS